MLNDKQLEYKQIIGQSTILTNKQIKTVVNKIEEINNVYRTTPIELIAGQNDFQVEVKHCGVTLKFNYQTVYWNTRLDTAHQDVINYCIKNCQDTHYILDLTCGVGPFTVPLLKQGKHVIANDLNPEAIKYLRLNCKKWKQNVQIFNQDGKILLQKLLKQNTQIIDIVIVNLPELSIDLIEKCRVQCVQNPTYIIECFSNEVEFVRQSVAMRVVAAAFGGWHHVLSDIDTLSDIDAPSPNRGGVGDGGYISDIPHIPSPHPHTDLPTDVNVGTPNADPIHGTTPVPDATTQMSQGTTAVTTTMPQVADHNNSTGITINTQPDYTNDSIVSYVILQQKIPNLTQKVEKIIKKHFKFFDVQIVRDVSPTKFYCKVVCQFCD